MTIEPVSLPSPELVEGAVPLPSPLAKVLNDPRLLARRPRLHIAMIGQRGVPATYGGVEHHVEELGARLAERGHRVTVFCRKGYSEEEPPTYRGMELRHLPSVATKHLEAISHSAASALSTFSSKPDVVHFHALGPGLVAPLARLNGRSAIVQTVHGLDGERAKWGKASARVLRRAERMSARVPDSTIVVSRDLQAHYDSVHARTTTAIPNGVVAPKPEPLSEIALEHGLRPGSYVLHVGRIVPEKRLDLLLKAFRRVRTSKRLVIAGGDSFSSDYVEEVHALAAADDRVLMLGYVFGAPLRGLYTNAAAFVLPSALEGLPLTLLEAASYGIPVVASDIAPHAEVMGASRPGARLFATGEEDALVDVLGETLTGGDKVVEGATALKTRVVSTHDWDATTDRVEAVYYNSVAARQFVR